MKKKILWVDDEIEFLTPHILFLTKKGYDVKSVFNGSDAIELAKTEQFDLIFLDENMPGVGGLSVLSTLKDFSPSTPIIMVTKSEKESTMDQAIGSSIAEYLIKPVSSIQIWATCKKFLNALKIRREEDSRAFLSEFNLISEKIKTASTADDWIFLYKKIIYWEQTLEIHKIDELRDLLATQKKEANAKFGKFIESTYQTWCTSKKNTRPLLSVDVLKNLVLPKINDHSFAFLFVIDCMRYDQWVAIKESISEYYNINTTPYYSILPTATGFARNAIFSGLFPEDIKKRFPQEWSPKDSTVSQNASEHILLADFFRRHKPSLSIQYTKLTTTEEGNHYAKKVKSISQKGLHAIVINFVDFLTHRRSDSQVIKELSPNEAAFRSLTKTWFLHSFFFQILRELSSKPNTVIFITTDHGSVQCKRKSKVHAEKEATPNMRFKFTLGLRGSSDHMIYIKNPADYRLPLSRHGENLVLAKEDFFFVYPNNLDWYARSFRDSFQHGGVSLEEMIIPFATLRAKQ